MRLIDSLATTEPLARLFSDASVLRAMLDFEVALALAEGRLGIIPSSASTAIAEAATDLADYDMEAIAAATLRAGTPGIPLVKALTERVRASDSSAAGFVHWGATSQDVADTAMVLLLKQTRAIFDASLGDLEAALKRLTEQHAQTVMLGRTLMQASPPVTFGLKAAGWLAAIRRVRAQLNASFTAALVLQFGGATGTLAALGERGLEVAELMARELGLVCPDAPWHTHRDRLAFLVCACGVLTGALGKMARDISLLMQSEVSEASEPGGQGRGGSSAMPHKRNPIGCALTLAAASRAPGLVSSFLSGMVQEHERGVGGWQAEWPTVSALIQCTGLAIASMAEVAQGLTIDQEKMRANIEATQGNIFSERAGILLGQAMGRDVAHRLLEEATRKSVSQRRRLSEVLAEMPEVAAHLQSNTLEDLENPEHYLGVASLLCERLLAKTAGTEPEKEKE